MENPLEERFGRVEIFEGATGRRSWTDEKKARIVAESFAPGASVNAVARRHGLQPQHLSTWRRLAKEGKIVLPAEADLPCFVPVVVEDARLSAVPSMDRDAPLMIEVQAGDLVLRAPDTIDPPTLASLIAAIRRLP